MSQVVAMRFLSVMSVKCCLAMVCVMQPLCQVVSDVFCCRQSFLNCILISAMCILLPAIVLEVHFDAVFQSGNRLHFHA